MASFGAELRRERELRRIGLREIAEATKVNLRHLEALEENRFDELPGGIFNRGMIRAYCNHIGIDGDSMVTAYLEEEGSRTRSGPLSSPEVLRGGSGSRRPEVSPKPADTATTPHHTKWLVMAFLALAALMALAAGALWWISERAVTNERVPVRFGSEERRG